MTDEDLARLEERIAQKWIGIGYGKPLILPPGAKITFVDAQPIDPLNDQPIDDLKKLIEEAGCARPDVVL